MKTNWVPEIMYEENEDGTSSHIPFIPVPSGESMPNLLYVFESRETGEHEPGLNGEEVPVIQWDLHQYADMSILKGNLDGITYDLVRSALGLEPLADAVEKGKNLTQSVRENIES
tara:strand:- start:134 stop:478 length:345 start_codon:yes stop_codon:yes gene_type:complete